MARRISPWIWLLAGGAAVMLYLRYRKGGEDFLVDAIEEITISAKKLTAGVSSWISKVPAALQGLFASAAARFALPTNLLEAVAYRESRFRPEIINGSLRSSAGAVGVMQIVPKWHMSLGEAGARDPARAIPYAAQYLRQLYQQFGSWPLALAAYNWGPGNLQKHLQGGGTPDRWPKETRDYVEEISRNAGLG